MKPDRFLGSEKSVMKTRFILFRRVGVFCSEDTTTCQQNSLPTKDEAEALMFLLIGIWHGVSWNYANSGLFQSLGVVANLHDSIGFKKWLGKDGFKAGRGQVIANA
jgi:D-alanyl-lipoteichoic acid acyltransferase DltB (MBOAT superfamily)